MVNKYRYSPVLILVLFLGAYPITHLLYNDMYEWAKTVCINTENPYTNLWNDWYLNLIFVGFAISIYINHKFLNNFWSSVLLGLSLANLVDAICFNIYEFRWNDIVAVGLTILLSYKKYIYVGQRC